jgi:hypothetical protein
VLFEIVKIVIIDFCLALNYWVPLVRFEKWLGVVGGEDRVDTALKLMVVGVKRDDDEQDRGGDWMEKGR